MSSLNTDNATASAIAFDFAELDDVTVTMVRRPKGFDPLHPAPFYELGLTGLSDTMLGLLLRGWGSAWVGENIKLKLTGKG